MGGVACLAFQRSEYLLLRWLERASRRYEFQRLAANAYAECFERRDVLGSRNEYSEVVWS
jgi:hypothetical protein